MPPDAENSYSPLTTDLWITHLFGFAHFYPAGVSISLCGKMWDNCIWDLSPEKPAECCLICDRLINQTLHKQGFRFAKTDKEPWWM